LDAPTVIETHKWLGETWGFWVQTGALIVSAVAAIYLIAASRKDNRRRATIDLVIQQKQDSELQTAKRFVLSLHENKVENLTKYLADKNSDECKNLLRVLNNYEFVAAGIREDALDEEIFKRVQFSVWIKDWDALSGVVMELRHSENRDTLFQEFQLMSARWKQKPLKCDIK